MILIPIIAFFLIIFGFLLYKHYSLKFSRQIAKKKFIQYIDTWSSKLNSKTTLFKSLTDQDQKQLLDAIQVFLSEKKWDKTISEDEKLLTSYYASLLIFKRKTNYYPNIKYINQFKPFEYWIEENEKQFEIDFGKMALKEMQGNFVKYTIEYFENVVAIKSERPKIYQQLNSYFKFWRQ